MLFDAIFLALFVGAWLLLSLLSWITLSMRRRAYGALWAAPFAALGGVAGGVLVPLAGLDNALGIGVSMIAALLGSAAAAWLSFSVWDSFQLGARFSRLGRRDR